MTLPISEQIVLVTGGGRGLGAAIARAFAREGARVLISYCKSREAAEALALELGPRAAALSGDVRDEGAMRQAAAEARGLFGAPTTVIHNALAPYRFNGDARDTLEDLMPEAIRTQVETAAIGALNVLKATKEAMEEAGFGRVVTIGSNLVQNPVVPYHDYTAGKAALLAMTRTAAAELGPKGITVNMVSGGLLRVTDASRATPDAVFDMIADATPLRQVTTPEALADAVLFFASPWARAVTGQNMIVDGGLVFG